mmetsp:Transcript_22671/g.52127  ORF Transcript_22671/g.52127 Transcript_22671/m.52127 type:complete len:160 (+) Transcript_22671:79-558(+)
MKMNPLSIINRYCSFVRSFVMILRFLRFRIFGLPFLQTHAARRGRQNPKLAQNPRRAVAGLRPDADPIFDAIDAQSYFFIAGGIGNGIVRAQHFEEFSVAGRPDVGRHHAIKGAAPVAPALESYSDDHCRSWSLNLIDSKMDWLDLVWHWRLWIELSGW